MSFSGFFQNSEPVEAVTDLIFRDKSTYSGPIKNRNFEGFSG